MNFEEKLANVVNRYEEVTALLTSTTAADELVKLNKELASLEPVAAAIKNYNHSLQTMRDDEEMAKDDSLDKEMRDMAESEYYEIKEKLPTLEKDIRILLLPKDEDDERTGVYPR